MYKITITSKKTGIVMKVYERETGFTESVDLETGKSTYAIFTENGTEHWDTSAFDMEAEWINEEE